MLNKVLYVINKSR